MADPIIVKEDTPQTEIELPNNGNAKQASDSSGFGLVNWLFDHINERKPVFLSLYREYEREVKLASTHKIINWTLLLLSTIGDFILFAIYAGAVILIIVGITFIFVKGTGLLDYFFRIM